MASLIYSLMSLLSQANRPWMGDSMALGSGRTMYINPSPSVFENNIGNGIYPNNGNVIPIIIASDSNEARPRSSYSPDNMHIPLDVLPISLPSMRNLDLRDIPEARPGLKSDFIQSLMDVIPASTQSIRSPYARSLPQPRNTFNPEIIPINMNDLPIYFPHESREMRPPRINSNPNIIKFIMDIHPTSPEAIESTEAKEMFQPRNFINPDVMQMVLSSLPLAQKPITQESRELSSPGLGLFNMFLDVPETSSQAPSLNEETTTPNFDISDLNTNNNAFLRFPMNFGRSMDSLPMAISDQIPPVLPPLVPAMNITAMTMCENSMIILSCPIGQTIHFVSVFYGRTSKDICNSNTAGLDYKNFDTTTCNLSSAMNTMVNLCEGQNACKMTANNTVFGEDPCPGIAKYMQISYYCR